MKFKKRKRVQKGKEINDTLPKKSKKKKKRLDVCYKLKT